MVQEITNAADRQFEWITEWKIEAPVEAVWTELIANIDRYPQWWENYTKAEPGESGWTPSPGDAIDLEMTGFLPGSFSFTLEAEDVAEYRSIIVCSTGEIIGRGQWIFASTDGGTEAIFRWIVDGPALGNLLASFPPVQYLVTKNHHSIMGNGYRGLVNRLENYG